MRVVVFGGRYFGDLASLKGDRSHPFWSQRETEYQFIMRALDKELCPEPDPNDMSTWMPPDGLRIINGGATGADSVSTDWCVVNWVPFTEYPVTKEDWRRLGRRAGPLRNQRMIDEGKPDKGIAFPGGSGTHDMKERMRRAGIPVKEFEFKWGGGETANAPVCKTGMSGGSTRPPFQ